MQLFTVPAGPNEVLLNVETAQIAEPDRRHGQDLDCNRKLSLERAGPKIAIPSGDADQLLWQAKYSTNSQDHQTVAGAFDFFR